MNKIFTIIISVLIYSSICYAQELTPDEQSSLNNQVNEYYYQAPTSIIKGAGTCFTHPNLQGDYILNCGDVSSAIVLNVVQNHGKIIWTDIADTTVVGNGSSFTYNLPIIDTAFTAHAYPGSDILITELDFGTPDIVEIQNMSNATINTEGWFVVVSNTYNDINAFNTTLWMLPDSILPGEILYKDDNTAGTQYWGSNLMFSQTAGNQVWAMIIDNCGNIVDALFHGWPKADINTMSINAGGFLIEPKDEWLGNGTVHDPTSVYSLLRKGDSDNQNASDFDVVVPTGSENPGVQYGPLTYPFTDITEINIPLANLNGQRGIMFNVEANVDLQIESFSPYLEMAAGDSVKVYYRLGDYSTFSTSLVGWTYAGFNIFTSAVSNTTTTNLPVGNIFVPAGSTMAIYIYATSASSTVQYSDGTVANTDGNIIVYDGEGVVSVGGTTYSPRYYIGGIHYSLGRGLEYNQADYYINNVINADLFSQTDNTCMGGVDGSVDSITVFETEAMNLGIFNNDFSGAAMTRGYGFTAPANIHINALKVPEMAVGDEVQNIQVVKFDASFGGTFTTLFYANNLAPNNWVGVDIDITQGDVIGIIGARGTTTMHNAYGPVGPFTTTMAGQTVILDRLYYQNNLNTTEATSGINQESSNSISQVDMMYTYVNNANCTYSWSNGATTELISGLIAGTYTLIATNTMGCLNEMNVDIQDGSNPSPVIDLGVDTTLCEYESIILDAGAGFVSYNWSTGGAVNTETIDTALVGIGTFPIWVSVEGANGCLGYDTVMVTFEICSEIETVNDVIVNLYPNPNSGEFNIDLSNLNGETTILISNISGQVVEEIKSEYSSSIVNVSLSNYDKGVYIISINNSEYKNTVKMLIK